MDLERWLVNDQAQASEIFPEIREQKDEVVAAHVDLRSQMRIPFCTVGMRTHASFRMGDILITARAGLLGLVIALVSCFAAEGAEQPQRNVQFRQLRLDGNFVRWPLQRGSDTLVLTYKVLDGFRAFDGARNCRRMTGIAEILHRAQINREQFDAELHEAFAMWEAAADVRFEEAHDGDTANIMIGAQADPEGWAFADVFYNAAAADPVKPISRALVCLNPKKAWKIGFDGDLRVYDLRYTLAHEIGHAIGLDHPNAPGQIMGYRYEESFRNLQPGDLSGAAALYGAPRSLTAARTPAAPKSSDNESADAGPSGGSTSRALFPNRN